MTLQEAYPKEWDDMTNEKVPKDEINEYLLRFVARLLKEVKEGKRNDIDLGDGFSIGKFAMGKYNKYKLNPSVEEFLIELGDYKIEINGGEVDSYMNSPKEVEAELEKISKKLGINLEI